MPLASLLRILSDPANRPMAVALAERIARGSRDFERLHPGERSRGAFATARAPEPDRIVLMGALSRVGYVTTKDGEQSEFIHVFGREDGVDDDGEPVFIGPRPLLAVGFYDDPTRKQELLILRGKSPYRVTTHGIED